jgi:hypothetical protein
MSGAIIAKDRDAFGSVAWVQRTGGHMSRAERWAKRSDCPTEGSPSSGTYFRFS